jgi:hypothetical protein
MAANAGLGSASQIRLLSILRLLATVLLILLGVWPSPIAIVALASPTSIPLNVWSEPLFVVRIGEMQVALPGQKSRSAAA